MPEAMRADSLGNATGKMGAMRAECRKESLDQFKTPDSNRPSTHQPQKHFRMMALMLRGLPMV